MPAAKKKNEAAPTAAAAPSSSDSNNETEVPHLVKEGTDRIEREKKESAKR
jgi:hypothetical protein